MWGSSVFDRAWYRRPSHFCQRRRRRTVLDGFAETVARGSVSQSARSSPQRTALARRVTTSVTSTKQKDDKKNRRRHTHEPQQNVPNRSSFGVHTTPCGSSEQFECQEKGAP